MKLCNITNENAVEAYNKFKLILYNRGFTFDVLQIEGDINILLLNIDLRTWAYNNCRNVYDDYALLNYPQIDCNIICIETYMRMLQTLLIYCWKLSSSILDEALLKRKCMEECIIVRLKLLSSGIAWINIPEMIQLEYPDDYDKVIPKKPTIFVLFKSKLIHRLIEKNQIRKVIEYDTYNKHKQVMKEISKGCKSMRWLKKHVEATKKRADILSLLVSIDCALEILSFNYGNKVANCARYHI